MLDMNIVCRYLSTRKDLIITLRLDTLIPYHITHDMSTVPIYCSGYGKREVNMNWSMVIPKKAAPITGITLTATIPAPAASRQ